MTCSKRSGGELLGGEVRCERKKRFMKRLNDVQCLAC